ncbi:anaphase-promoting complex subunit 2-like [Anopheles albimanus]|uniref:Anaphase-promoting complex subunit 2 n=1 Tax=Anopheles albimanus TaxID=7167 RepID=A0A182FEQ0_ANOAL|nr:anaphase-promoting complex subunit 2-like [Anopheles albimanus]
MSNFEQLEQILVKVFPVLNGITKEEKVTTDELTNLHQVLVNESIVSFVYERVFQQIGKTVRYTTVPQFWSHFSPSIPGHESPARSATTAASDNARFFQFQHAIKELYTQYAFYRRQLKRLEVVCPASCIPRFTKKKPNEVMHFCNTFRTKLLAQLPVYFNDLVEEFYKIAFRVFACTYGESEAEYIDVPETNQCVACGVASASCQCQMIANAFGSTNKYLWQMGLMNPIAGYAIEALAMERINVKVNETKEDHEISHLDSLEQWLNTVLMHWITRIYNQGSLEVHPEQRVVQDIIKDFKQRLSLHLFESYANAIMDQFFQIIINFPSTRAAVDDLKVCLVNIKLKQCFVTTIRQMLQKRLLHPGVDTSDILTGYVAALKTLGHFDPSNVLLRSITKPIKDYLRGRPETVRCVVTSLTGDGSSDLAEELAKSESSKPKETNDTPEDTDWESWNPEPANVATAVQRALIAGKEVDIIAMVVEIYGSKEIFVNEYRNLLAERLLSLVDFCPEREMRNLELLKLRFGETLLHSCEVMLKDIADSKRINDHIVGEEGGFSEDIPFKLSALIVSSQFWPTFKKETMDLPPAIQRVFDKYTKCYETYKANRTLQWTPLNGKVSITIENDGKVQDMQVTPAQAAIAIHFSEQPQWELDLLAQKMNMPPIVLRKRLVFWQSNGLLREAQENLFVLVDKSDESAKLADQLLSQQDNMCEEEEVESAMESASDQREEELQVFWSYIEAMLTNLDSLPLDRIHQMLKMFASQVDFTQDELKHILQKKVREHKLVYAGGVYQLPKS